jgi:hypothetical protein
MDNKTVVSTTPIERAVGSPAARAAQARLLAIGEDASQQAIGLWLKAGQCGKGWALPIARAIEFEVTPHELDRRNYPNPWDGLPRDRARPLHLGARCMT